MSIYDELKSDHKQVSDMLGRLDEMSSRAIVAKKRLFEEMKTALTAHSRAEEKVFYDALKSAKDAHDIILEGYEEHHVLDVLLEEMIAIDPHDEKWAAKLSVLTENVKHHVEEEEGDIFKKARKIFDTATAKKLGEEFVATKEQMLQTAPT
ncbi:MAG TPA: hemerythrin domain-containing protein [Stellaceae bacterium]|jgi:hemerythrin superfamily protein|nr:hemerythrin domain-containing protein [Stellaceae bacterium]